ncbi:hypothetical protein [Burkholderia gladioli]|uniref:hypothetical protein n=1 Tax=Burkholderia gladioli TaxID=28095 RepID=UPI0016410D84|nr:hypothetical protein [Burkholderia gladioli]
MANDFLTDEEIADYRRELVALFNAALASGKVSELQGVIHKMMERVVRENLAVDDLITTGAEIAEKASELVEDIKAGRAEKPDEHFRAFQNVLRESPSFADVAVLMKSLELRLKVEDIF